MFLGIEIGGTKLQLGVGRGDGATLTALERFDVNPRLGAAGILAQIDAAAGILIGRHQVSAMAIGFGGPVDADRGRVIKSHHVEGWEDFPLVDWCRDKLAVPARLQNDCDSAGLAEARFGAGRGRKVVFYVTVGTGIGGGLVIDGRIYRGSGVGAGEIGHLRPGLHAQDTEQTVESLASGWGIAAAAQARLGDPTASPSIPFQSHLRLADPEMVRQHLIDTEQAEEEFVADLRERCDGQLELLTAKLVAQAAAEGNEIAREVLAGACQTLGWGIAQVVTIVAPDVVVVGGGVSLIDESLFLLPLRREVDRYVFGPLVGKFQIAPAELGETVVVHGALAVAAAMS